MEEYDDSHLSSKTKRIARLAKEARIAYIRANFALVTRIGGPSPIYVPYDRERNIREVIRIRLLDLAQLGLARGMTLFGPGGAGKSALIQHLLATLGYVMESEGVFSNGRNRIAWLDVTETSVEKRILGTILKVLDPTLLTKRDSNVDSLREEVVRLIRDKNVILLVLDECQHMLTGGKKRQETQNLVKRLYNDRHFRGCSILLVGTAQVQLVLGTDDQMIRRFPYFELGPWENGEEGSREAFREWLKLLVKALPLRKRSILYDEAIIDEILSQTNGMTGSILELVVEATVNAIEDESEEITIETIRKAGMILRYAKYGGIDPDAKSGDSQPHAGE